MHVKMAKDNEVWMGDTESPLNAHAFISMEVDRTDPPSSEHCTLILRSESVLTWFSNDSSSCTTDSDDLSIELEQDASDEIIPIWDGVIRTSPFSSLMANNCPFENQQNLNYLNKHYKPSSRDVICARGYSRFDHIGNRRFHLVVASYLPSYTVAESRSERSQILTEIVRCVQDAGGIFIRYDRTFGLWYNIGEAGAIRIVFNVIHYLLSRIASAKCNANDDAAEFLSRSIQDDLQ